MACLEQRKVYLSLFVRSIPGIVVKKTVTLSCKPMQQFHGQMNLLKNEMDRWQQGRFNVFIIADGKERMKKVQTILQDYDMESSYLENHQKQEAYLFSMAICQRDSSCRSSTLQSSRILNCSKENQNEKHVLKR